MTDPQPPFRYRVFNALRRWSEDRQVEPVTYVQQWRRWWAKEPTKVRPFLNLRVSRGKVRKVA